MTRLYLDIETYSSVDLPKTGVYRYAASPDFLILMAAWAIDDGPVQMALTHEDINEIPGLWDSEVLKVAHNAQFERICFSSLVDEPEEPEPFYLDPVEWYDTQAVAAEHGWPQKLEVLARALGGEQKDSAGTRLISKFCKPNRKGERNKPEDFPDDWMDFIEYCRQDVVALRDIDRTLPGFPTRTEHDLFVVDQLIADRGIAINVPMARKAVAAAELNQGEQLAQVRELSGVENPNSIQQMGAWLREQGLEAPDMRADTVQALLDGDLSPLQRRVLELRQELALVASKKYATALASEVGGRLRGTLKFFGAHTGRWSGRGTQIQNLPRLTFKNDVDTEMAILELMGDERVSAEDLKRLVRPLFTGPFTVVDYAAIEARVIAWLAGEQWALDAFALGRDIYIETAERMGGLTRSQGKIAVLGLGYAGSVNTLVALGGIPGMDESGYKRLVDQWRRANPNIVKFWAKMEHAFGEGGMAGNHISVTEEQDQLGRCVRLGLPSGRSIVYHDVRWERYVVVDPVTKRNVYKQSWRFANPKDPFNHKMRIGTYGGSLAENVTQAVARDIMAEALIRLENQGYAVVGHVHDEILVEGEHDVETIKSIMTQTPEWAAGLPIDGEGFQTYRYKKG